jgi:SHS family lactate transporter-like MFS transporter
MITALFLALLAIPLWILAPTAGLLVLGAFLIQFMVQGAFGVVPSHINELSPDQGRGFFPGFAFQIGVLCASSIAYLEALLGERFSYEKSMGVLAAITFVGAILAIALGPEAKGIIFGRQKAPHATPVR